MPDNRTLGNAALVLDYTQIPELAALVRSAERRLAALERVAQAARERPHGGMRKCSAASPCGMCAALATLDALEGGRDG